MPINSCQLYVKGLLDGLSIPTPSGGTQTLTAWITPPTVENMDGPRAYIWGARQKGHRQTMPRAKPGQPTTGGFKRLDYTMDIYLSYLTNPNDAQVEQEFPLLIDTVLQTLWSTQIPVFINSSGHVVSPGGAGDSEILSIGEDWELEYPPERTPATLRMLYYSCRIGMDIYEAVQG